MAARRAEQALETANANVALAQRTLRLAQSQKDAGTGTGIEVTRAEVLMANERQRQTQAQEDLQSARLQLARAIGLPFETEFALTTPLAYVPFEAPEAPGAIRGAVDSRPEILAQVERQKAAQLNASASRWERLPSLGVFGDYGNIGTDVGSGRATRTAGVQVRIPLFDGGRRDARQQEAASVARQESIRTRDTKAQVELEVRLAIEALRSAEAQLQAALVARSQAERELAQAERRFTAGVAPGFEVTDAQTRLARAREAVVNALFRQKASAIDYGAATGNLEPVLR
jgi:outer membrane protein TolC